MSHSTNLGLGPGVVEGARISMSQVGLGLALQLHPELGTMEAMPKLVLILREFEMTGGIQR